MPQFHDNDLPLSKEDCRYSIRAMELEAYTSIISALRAQGEFSDYCRLILEHLRILLNVSWERHKAEVRRALSDPILAKISSTLNPLNDTAFEWVEEAKRTCANPSESSSHFPPLCQLDYIRRTCNAKNDSLIQLANHLASLGVQHNRSKVENGEERFFRALKSNKAIGLSGNPQIMDLLEKLIRTQCADVDDSTASASQSVQPTTSNIVKPEPATDVGSADLCTSNNNDGAIDITDVGANLDTGTTNLQKKAGRPKKRLLVDSNGAGTGQMKQVSGGKSSSSPPSQSVRISSRGRSVRGTKRAMANNAQMQQRRSASSEAKEQRQMQQNSAFYPFYHRIQQRLNTSTGAEHSDQSLSGRERQDTYQQQPQSTADRLTGSSRGGKSLVMSRQQRKRRANGSDVFESEQKPTASFVTSLSNETTSAQSSRTMTPSSGTKFGKVPVSPLPVMLPAGATRGGASKASFGVDSGSPSRAHRTLSDEAPGVYADDYNAGSLSGTPPPSNVVAKSPSSSASVGQAGYYSSLSASYLAQQRLSPASQEENSARMTGITVKSSSVNGRAGASPPVHKDSSTLTVSSSIVPTTVATPRVEQTAGGHKVIVLQSSTARRPQQQLNQKVTHIRCINSSSSQNAEPGAVAPQQQQQSIIIVRRANSVPSTPCTATIISPATLPATTVNAVQSQQEH